MFTAAMAAAGCGDNSKECGPGTTDVSGFCVPVCGEGTVLAEGVGCVPDLGAAPTVTAISPTTDLLGGGATFTITGTGFSRLGDIEILFGEVAAVFDIVSDTTLRGTVPRGEARDVVVTVTTELGSGTTNFRYTGLYMADGRGGQPGKLFLVDPRDGTNVTIGPIQESDGTAHAVTGLAFDASGALFATESIAAEGDGKGKGGTANLLRIDPATATATVVGLLNEDIGKGSFANHGTIADITFNGATLVGWTEMEDAPVSIDTTTGAVTVLGPGVSSAGSGVTTLADGSSVVVPDGPTGFLHTINLTDGTTTELVQLVYDGQIGEVCGMTTAGSSVFALLCNDNGTDSGTAVASIDLETGDVTVLATAPLNVDAVASEPGLVVPRIVPTTPNAALTATLERAAACAPKAGVIELAGARTGRLVASELATSHRSVAVTSKRAGVRGLPLDAIASGTVTASACGGEPLRLTRDDLASYALVANQRGRIKLVDRYSGRPVLRNVTALRAE